MNNCTNKEEFEKCVICGKVTNFLVSMPIDLRENYEIGLGQVCVDCARKQQEVNTLQKTLTAGQIQYAVEESRKNNNEL